MNNQYLSRGSDITNIDGQDFKYYGHAEGYIVYSSGDKLYCGVDNQMVELAIGPSDVGNISSGTMIPVPNTDIKLNPVDLYANDYLPVNFTEKNGDVVIPNEIAGSKTQETQTPPPTETKNDNVDVSVSDNTTESNKSPVHGGGGGSFGDEKNSKTETTTETITEKEKGENPVRESGGHRISPNGTPQKITDMENSVYAVDDKYKNTTAEEETTTTPKVDTEAPTTQYSDSLSQIYTTEKTGSGSWDFTVDSELQITIKDKLNNAAEEFDSEISELYVAIDQKLKEHWQGNDYDAYRTGANAYKEALKDLGNSMRMFANHFDKLATATDTLSEELLILIQNATSRNTK